MLARERETNVADLANRLDALEHRVSEIADQLKQLSKHHAALERLRQDVANIKSEVEDRSEFS